MEPVLGTHKTPVTLAENAPGQSKSYTYYHAGPLFTLAELHMNSLLAEAIKGYSSSKFIPVVPQDLEQRDISPHGIRDQDIRSLLSCDLALFTYDGHELDAGTVVEYMVAKMADIPAVILRTDFRGAGDQGANGDSWNLMSSFWPRTVSLSIDAMVGYKKGLASVIGNNAGGKKAGEILMIDVAQRIVGAFTEVLQKPARLPKELRESVYEWLALMPGFREGGDEANTREMLDLSLQKSYKGLL